jgi:beta-glucanase (GH16 family)
MQIDRDRIAKYRSGQFKPIYATTFTDPDELKSNWTLESNDPAGLKSCRRPENIGVSPNGLRLATELASDCKNKWSTGSMVSKFKQKYGFFEATIKIADCNGTNNAFWLTTDDNFEIDNPEIHYPSQVGTGLHNWNDYSKHFRNGDITAVGYHQNFKENLSAGFHDYGVLWTGNVLVYEVDGQPTNVIATNGSIHGAAQVRFSTAIAEFAGKIPEHPENHAMRVKSLRIYAIQP